MVPCVVSYRNSTSNHNNESDGTLRLIVVSYRNSTSNHNLSCRSVAGYAVVSYRNSTSNHNIAVGVGSNSKLYLIEILHQTTTRSSVVDGSVCCILSKFYIKPQLIRVLVIKLLVVSYRNSTSNHNLFAHMDTQSSVVSYRNSTSNHNKYRV